MQEIQKFVWRNHLHCPLCKGNCTQGQTTFSVDLGFDVLVVRDVPSLICSQCGEEWLEDN